jgi:metal-dependent amidase/aminoacylase/carboxypeptidase family protein
MQPSHHLDELIARALPRVRDLRRSLHRHPEIAFEERRTAAAIERFLSDAGVPFVAGLAKGTGIVAHLPGEGDAAVALRADIDALPIEEASGVP